MNELKISVNETDHGTYIADAVNLPGSPPIGQGGTYLEALGCLIWRLAFDRDYKKYHNITLVEDNE